MWVLSSAHTLTHTYVTHTLNLLGGYWECLRQDAGSRKKPCSEQPCMCVCVCMCAILKCGHGAINYRIGATVRGNNKMKPVTPNQWYLYIRGHLHLPGGMWKSVE